MSKKRTHLPDKEKALDVYLRERVKKEKGQYIKLGTTYMSGLPDRMILLPDARIRFAELKSKGNKPTALQLSWFKVLRGLGFEVYCITGGEPVEVLIDLFI